MNNLNVQHPEDALYDTDNSPWVEKKVALDRLMDNADFKLLIVDGYLRDYAADQVSLLANDQIKRTGARPDVMESLVAISHLRDFFMTIENLAADEQGGTDLEPEQEAI